MKCISCDGKGWTESYYAGAASWTPNLQQCPKRCDIGKYSAEVMKRLNNPKYVTPQPVLQGRPMSNHVAQVIPFKRKIQDESPRS